jgi:thymidylate kinase
VEEGYAAILSEEPERVRQVDAGGTIEEINESVWRLVKPMLTA